MDENKPTTAGFCRACLIKYQDPLELIPYTEKNRRLFVYATGLQVKRNDNFVFQLCKYCFSNLRMASKFKKQCRASDKKFKTFMGLKKLGSDIDFCSYIKNADNSYAFRVPSVMGDCATSPRKTMQDNDKDETASTSTSIRNFMTDILRDEDIPATEARIINEVIAEEADILEDSLDSQWLEEDDMSINENINLDFSLSPFSTPKLDSDERYPSLENINCNKNELPSKQQLTLDAPVKSEVLDDELMEVIQQENIEAVRNLGFYQDKEIELDTVSVKTFHIDEDHSKIQANKCVIDKNLSIAIKNESDLISLDELLKSPAATRGKNISRSTTPAFKKFIFQEYKSQSTPEYIRDLDKPISIDLNRDQYSNFDPDELLIRLKDVDEDKNTQEKENTIESDVDYKEETEDETIPNDNNENEETSSEHSETDAITSPIKSSFDIENLYCKLCKKDFKSVTGIKSHAKRVHQYRLPATERVRRKGVLRICDHCGKKITDKRNFIRHIKTHEPKTQVFKCETCGSVFQKASHLRMHSFHHMRPEERDKAWEDRRKFICNICGAKYTSRATLKLHVMRHAGHYKYGCTECYKLYHRKHDLDVHMRYHTGEKPFSCDHCEKSYTRRDQLTHHLLSHYSKFQCKICNRCFSNESALDKHTSRLRKCKNKGPEQIKGKYQKKKKLKIKESESLDKEEIKTIVDS